MDANERLRAIAESFVADIANEVPGVVAVLILSQPDPSASPFAVATNTHVRGDAVKLLGAARVALAGT